MEPHNYTHLIFINNTQVVFRMAKSVNIQYAVQESSIKTENASFRKVCLKDLPLIGILDQFALTSLSVHTMWFMLNTAFLLRVWNFDICQAANAQETIIPQNTLITEPLLSFHGRKHFIHCHNSLLWKLKAFCITPLEDSQNFIPVFLLPHISIPFVNFSFESCFS